MFFLPVNVGGSTHIHVGGKNVDSTVPAFAMVVTPHWFLIITCSAITFIRSSSVYPGLIMPAAAQQLFQIFQIWSNPAYVYNICNFSL